MILWVTTDANGTVTHRVYGSVGSASSLYPTSVTVAYGTNLAETTTRSYDLATGLTTQTIDPNGVITATAYDALGRPTLVTAAQGTADEAKTSYTYSDTDRYVMTVGSIGSQELDGPVTIQRFDPLGRTRLHQLLDTAGTPNPADETAGIKVQTSYIYSGAYSYKAVSNPFKTGSEPSAGWTRTKVDAAGRVVESRSFGGTGRPYPWNGNSSDSDPGTGSAVSVYHAGLAGAVTTGSVLGSSVQTTDQAGQTRVMISDALGRMVQVMENSTASPVLTSYSYDALDSLTGVIQGSLNRTFTYTSQKRLVTANNPESGMICYGLIQSGSCVAGYDANGNLLHKVDARNARIDYTFDALNRMTSKTYSGMAVTTPSVTYCYDSLPQAPGSCGTTQTTGFIGRLTEKYSPAATAGNFPAMAEDYLSFDAFGRVLQSRQTTGTAYPVLTYTYNKQGALASMKYPSGKTVSYGFDAAARVSSVLGNANVPYVSSISYAPHGGIAQAVLQNGLIESTCYNSWVQVSQIRLATTANADPTVCAGDTNDKLNLSYGYGTTTNNGNVLSQTIVRGSASWQQTYSYGDGFNRLTGAVETALGTWCTANCSWTENYGFDNAGNRWVTAHTGLVALSLETPVASTWFNTSTNRINGWGYDASGNVQSVTGMSRSFTYDEEGRQTSALINGQTTSYFYDGDGKRVRKIAPCGTAQCTTDYIHDAAGQLVAEYSGAPVAESGTVYLTVDALGSTRVLSDAGGLVKEANDYLPFGGDLTAGVAAASGRTTAMGFNDPSATAGLRQDVEFTGKERDGESGLDYFGARYYGGAQGRFTSADPLLSSAHVASPQSWNRYSYALNNPLRFTDPFGLYICNGTKTECSGFESSLKQVERARNSYKKGSAEYNALNSSLQAYGKKGVDNGVTVQFGATKSGGAGDTNIGFSIAVGTSNKTVTADNPSGQNTIVTFDLAKHMTDGSVDIGSLAISAAHEGIHVADGIAFVGALPMDLTRAGAAAVLGGPLNLTKYATEFGAYTGSSYTAQGLGMGSLKIGGNFEIWNSGWKAVDVNTLRSNGINGILSDPNGLYKVTPEAPGKKLIE